MTEFGMVALAPVKSLLKASYTFVYPIPLLSCVRWAGLSVTAVKKPFEHI